MPRLRIGVNALYLIPGGVGGTEIYLQNLLAALAEIDRQDEFVVFTSREAGAELAPRAPNFSIVRTSIPASFRPARIVWEQTGLPAGIARRRLHVLLNPGFTAPLLSPCPMVTVFHDLQHKRHPEHFRWFDLPFWRLLLWASARRSAMLLADSHTTQEDLLTYYPIAADRIQVVPLGVDPAFFDLAKRRKQAENYLLAVSTLHPHKNLGLLLHAFSEFRRVRPEFRLVVAGLRGFHAAQLEQLRAELGLAGAVEFTGWVPRAALYELYLHASAFLYPSTFEGFGLPILEAMAAGVPAACSRIEPLSSNVGAAALTFDPESLSELVEAMHRLVGDGALRDRLAREGPRRAAEFSWRRTAELTLAALRAAAGLQLGHHHTMHF